MGMARAIFIALISLVFAAQALAGPRKPKILYIHSDTAFPANVTDVVTKLSGAGPFASVSSFDGGVATPTLAFLKTFDAALVANHQSWSDKVAMGNVLADYVDAGYGVVLAPFANAGVYPDNGLAGRWTGLYNCILFSQYASGPATLGTITLPDHLPSSGVQTFSGGSSSFRPSTTALQPGCAICLSWSDGKPLAAFGPLPNRADIGFYPTSSDVNPAYWNTSGDGLKIMVNSILLTIRPKILICASAALNNSVLDPRFTDPRNRLGGTGFFGGIDLFDANLDTPTLDFLKNYDAVLTWTNVALANPVAFGNVLADYVDAGYGVVAAMFASAVGMNNFRIDGRWVTGGYQLIDSAGGSTSGTNATLGSVLYPSHPAMTGVATFNGGVSSFRPASTTLPSTAILIAQWSDGKPLIVASTKFHNRCDLGMYPPSSIVNPNFWVDGTDGPNILANALRYTIRPYVGILHSETNGLTYLTQNRLFLLRRFSGVDLLNPLQTETPTAAALRPYSSLLLWGNTNFLDAPTLGNRLADYVDANGGVAVGLYSNVSVPGTTNNRPKGRWIAQGYDITPESLLPTATTSANATLGSVLVPGHPLALFIRKFNGGTGSVRQSTVPNFRGYPVTQWSDGKMLTSIHNFRKRVDLGFYPASSQEYGPGWNVRTDGAAIEANALDFVANMKPCPGDFNGDGRIDDTDFVVFADYYTNFLDPRGDLTGDGQTDDLDFALFANGYDQFLCP